MSATLEHYSAALCRVLTRRQRTDTRRLWNNTDRNREYFAHHYAVWDNTDDNKLINYKVLSRSMLQWGVEKFLMQSGEKEGTRDIFFIFYFYFMTFCVTLQKRSQNSHTLNRTREKYSRNTTSYQNRYANSFDSAKLWKEIKTCTNILQGVWTFLRTQVFRDGQKLLTPCVNLCLSCASSGCILLALNFLQYRLSNVASFPKPRDPRGGADLRFLNPQQDTSLHCQKTTLSGLRSLA